MPTDLLEEVFMEVPLSTVKARIFRMSQRDGLNVRYIGSRGDSRKIIVNGMAVDLETFARSNGLLGVDEVIIYGGRGVRKNVKNGLRVPVTKTAVIARLRRKGCEFKELNGAVRVRGCGGWVLLEEYARHDGTLKDFEVIV